MGYNDAYNGFHISSGNLASGVTGSDFVVTSDGYTGIGNYAAERTDPVVSLLHVATNWDNGGVPMVHFKGANNEAPTNGNAGGNISFQISDENSNVLHKVWNTGGGNSDYGKVFYAGQMGIGTEDPDSQLEIRSSAGTYTPVLKISNHNTGAYAGAIKFESKHSSTIYETAAIYGYGGSGSSDGILAFQTRTAERIRIDAVGMTGVRTTVPRATLHVKAHDNNWEGGILLEDNTGDDGWNIHPESSDASLLFGYNDNTSLALTSQTAELMVKITSAGNLGVGLPSPNVRLHAQDDSATETEILKLRNYKSSVNTKPTLVFEAASSAGQGANSSIQGLAGTDAGGSNSANDSGMKFIVRYGGSGTERTAMTIEKSGAVIHNQAPAFFAAIASSHSISNQTMSLLPFQNNVGPGFDTNSCWDNSNYRFTPNIEGYYQINMQLSVSYGSLQAGQAWIYKNGSGYTYSQLYNSAGDNFDDICMSVSTLVYLNGAGDYIDGRALRNGGNGGRGSNFMDQQISGFLARAV